MNNKLFVAGLDYDFTDETLAELFSDLGSVTSANVAIDRETGKPRGYGFVEMSDEDQAAAAIKALDGQTLMGRKLVVNLAKSRPNSR